MYHCHHSKGPGGEIPVADGISLGSLWNRSGHSGHPGANISRSLSVERTDCAVYSIFKVLKYFLLYTANMKFSLLAVSCFFRWRLPGCGSTTGFGGSPQICVWISKRYACKTICQQVGPLGGPFPPSRWEKPAGRVNHAMIHSLPTFPVHSEKVNHSMIHFFQKIVSPYES